MRTIDPDTMPTAVPSARLCSGAKASSGARSGGFARSSVIGLGRLIRSPATAVIDSRSDVRRREVADYVSNDLLEGCPGLESDRAFQLRDIRYPAQHIFEALCVRLLVGHVHDR